MRIEFPFEAESYRNEITMIYSESHKAHKRQGRAGLIYTLGFFSLALISMVINFVDHSYLIFVFIALGLHYLVNYINFVQQLIEIKRAYFIAIDEIIRNEESANIMNVIEFKNEEFYYENAQIKCAIYWKVFSGYRLKDNVLFLNIPNQDLPSYVFSKSQFGDEKFDEIRKFIERKVSLNSKDQGASNASVKHSKNSDLLDN